MHLYPREHTLIDYKFYCFNGKVKLLGIYSGKKDRRGDFFDEDFNHVDLNWGFKNADMLPNKPNNYQEMIEIAKELSKGIPQVRVDLYNINNIVKFGELTLFDGGGFNIINPIKWDYILGEYIDLNINNYE